jgi:hypothetical protein
MNEQNIHRLDISPDWEFTHTKDRNRPTFALISSASCPGYSIQLSPWRLRKKIGQTLDLPELATHAFRKLRNTLGEEAFPETNRVEAESIGSGRNPLMKYRRLCLDKKNPEKIQFDVMTANTEDLFSPRVAEVSIPFLTLSRRDQVEYEIDRAPWPFDLPPRALEHLATSGFKSPFPWGVIAIPPHGNDVWIVSKFSQNEIGVKYDRKATMEREFPELHALCQGARIMRGELAEARVIPDALAVEIHSLLAEILTPEELAIWHAMRKAGGSQKCALPSLQKKDIVRSAPTLSRRVKMINAKLIANRLTPCDVPAPPVRYNRSGGCENENGKTIPEELSAVERDWADDPAERDTTIRTYLTVSPAEKLFFQQTKPGIEEEARRYLKCRR